MHEKNQNNHLKNKTYRSLAAVSAFLLTLISCNTQYRVWLGPNGEQKVYNLKYGLEDRHTMDVFLPPASNANVPVAVLIHGGAWKFGRKEYMMHIQKFLLQNGIPSININYRLVQRKKGITYRDQLEDVNLAIKSFNSLAEKAKVKPNNYILLGESAGAHLSLLYGYQNPERVKKIISLSAPTDFYTKTYRNSAYFRYSSPTFEDVAGAKYTQKEGDEKFIKASPIANVSNVPTLIFQGNFDLIVSKKQGISLDSALTAQGVDHEFIFMKATGHTPRIFNRKKRDKLIYPAILRWFRN